MGKLTKEKIDEIQRLYREGYTKKEISEKVHVDRGTVTKYVEDESNRGEISPEDSDLVDLKKEKERYQVLAELDKLRLESQRIPERLELFEGELNNLAITLKAFGEDLERLRLRVNSQPDFSKVKCPKCGDYMAVDATCVSCNHKYWFGLWPGGK